MATQHIENSDRGFTINNGLAWTIVTSLALAVFWGGTTIQGMRSSIEALATSLTERRDEQREAKAERSQMDVRVRSLENDRGKQTVQYENVSSDLKDLKAAQAEMNMLLRQLSQRIPL